MSTDYTLHCKQCDVTPHEYCQTNGEHILKEIYKLRKAITALYEQDKTGYIEVHIMGKTYVGDLWAFLSVHQDHDMDIQDEYGGTEPLEEQEEEAQVIKSDLLANRAPASQHYKAFAIEPLQYIEANGLGFSEGNVIKYVSRWRQKDGLDDLRKARFYVDRLIEQAEQEVAGE